jgi:hypothetical protein
VYHSKFDTVVSEVNEAQAAGYPDSLERRICTDLDQQMLNIYDPKCTILFVDTGATTTRYMWHIRRVKQTTLFKFVLIGCTLCLPNALFDYNNQCTHG